MRIAAGILRWVGGGILVLLVALAGFAFILLRTQPGHDLFLRAALPQAARFVNGEVRVGGLRSEGLLRGFTLRDLSVADSAGRSFLLADSLRIRYSISDLLRRNIVLVPVDIWGPRVVVETLHGDSRSNVGRIMGSLDGGRPGAGISVSLRQTTIHDGEVLIRLPVDGSALSGRGVHERLEGEGGGNYRLLQFRQIEARVSDADLLGPALNGQSVRFEQLAFVGQLLEEPFTVTELRGDFLWEGSSVRLDFDRLWMPASELSGGAKLSWGTPEGVNIEADIQADVLQFADFQWLEPRLPAGGGRLSLRVFGPLNHTAWRIVGADLEAQGSGVQGELGFDLGPEVRFADTELEFRPLHLRELAAWLPQPLPFEGAVTGALHAEGALDQLHLSGQLSFEDADRGIPSSTAVVDGTLQVGEELGASDFSVTIEPLRYGTVRAFLPDLELSGEGSASIRATGQLGSSVQMSGELEHEGDGYRSQLSVSGTIQRTDEELTLALAATLDALSLDGLAAGLGRAFPVSGEVSGFVRAAGPISDLLLSGALITPGGPLEASARLDLRNPFSRYRVEASLEGFRLDQMDSRLPDPTVVTGEVLIDGAGIDPEDLRGTADLAIRDSRVGRAELAGLDARLRAVGGRLLVDELNLRSPVITVSGSGDLALREDQPGGRLSLSWAADSLSALRPILRGGEVIAADTLTQLEREILRLDGIDPDTLGAANQIALQGAARGEVILRGGVRDLEGEGFAEITGAAFGESSVMRSRADLKGNWRGAEDWIAEAIVGFDNLSLQRFEFARGSGRVSYGSSGVGDFDLSVEGLSAEIYAAEGALEGDSLGVEAVFRTLEIQLENEKWGLEMPTRVRLEASSIQTDELRLVGPSPGVGPEGAPASIEVRGTLDLERTSDFSMHVSGVDLGRLATVAQTERLPSGIVDLTVSISGPAGSPLMQGDVLVQDFALNGTALSRLEGTVQYEDLALQTLLTGDLNGRRLFTLEGRVPADLAFGEVEDRFPDRAIDLAVAVDSFPASTALAFLDALEEVEGSFDGQIRLQGTPEDLRPSGEIRLRGGGMSLPGLGLRPTALSVDLRVREDFRVDVQAQARAGGRAEITGTLGLANLTDPEFDLQLSASGFQAVDRRDLTAQIGGELTLTGPYSAPQVGGAVSVERGELFLEEFARGAEVIDLSDPRFFDVVDTSLVGVRPIAETAGNAFLRNLRVDVALTLEQDFWIRSQESTQGMDVEVGGDLDLTFDRPARELRLVGSLEAVRGSYGQFGRVFDVESGTVEFVGTPGIDPSLSIQAVHRLRREAAEPLNVIANVGGTLQNLQVTLSSDAQPPIPESDLISYMLFGRPSYALASGEISVVEGAAAGLVRATLSLGVSQLGSTFGRSLGVDYFSVSSAQQSGGFGAFRTPTGIFADTQIEMGRYVDENVFLAVTLRPLTGSGSLRRTQLPGARLEWRFRELWSAEGFLQDRLARLSAASFGELDNDFARVFGISLFREWGY